jgi:hypothetical protein
MLGLTQSPAVLMDICIKIRKADGSSVIGTRRHFFDSLGLLPRSISMRKMRSCGFVAEEAGSKQ